LICLALWHSLVDLSNSSDGANSRLILWQHFSSHYHDFLVFGMGLHNLKSMLLELNIDNYHMFFMNQIAAYGLMHCIAFNAVLIVVVLRSGFRRSNCLLFCALLLNICFQTYGYEYQNLFLFCIAANMRKPPSHNGCVNDTVP
jgi:hypothetical protein